MEKPEHWYWDPYFLDPVFLILLSHILLLVLFAMPLELSKGSEEVKNISHWQLKIIF